MAHLQVHVAPARKSDTLNSPIDLGIAAVSVSSMPNELVLANARELSQVTERGYTPVAGVREFRQALADYFTRTEGVSVGFEETAFVAGARAATSTAISWMLSKSGRCRRVLVPPYRWPTYDSQIHDLGGVAIPVEASDTMGFLPLAHNFENEIENFTAGIIITNPGNPIPNSYSPEQLREIARLAIRHKLPLLVDEAYFDFSPQHASILRACSPQEQARLRKYLLIARTIGKGFQCPSLGAGYLLSSQEVIETFVSSESHFRHGVAPAVQAMVVAACQMSEESRAEYITGVLETVSLNHKAVREFAERIEYTTNRYLIPNSVNAPLAFIDLSQLSLAAGKTVSDIVAGLGSLGVTVSDGARFGDRAAIRISLGKPHDVICSALAVMEDYFRRLLDAKVSG